jgi:hypothetical protein
MNSFLRCPWPTALIVSVLGLLSLGWSDAAAQSKSSALVANDLLGQYAIIKRTIAPQRELYYFLTGKANDDKEYNIADCGSLDLNFGLYKSDWKSGALGSIAAHFYMWTSELPTLGYPGEMIAPLISDFESKALQHLARAKKFEDFDKGVDREMRALAKQLADLRSRRGLKAIKTEYNPECGGGGVVVTFKVPQGARLFIVPTFFARFCENQKNVNPADMTKCDHYSEVFDGAQDRLAGSYRYIGRWDSDGHERKGTIEVGKVGQEGYEGKVFRLTR